VKGTRQAMREASEMVLPGFPLRTDAEAVRHPERFVDPRGKQMWETVWGLIRKQGKLSHRWDNSTGTVVSPVRQGCLTGGTPVQSISISSSILL
jgi:hypothetical protein